MTMCRVFTAGIKHQALQNSEGPASGACCQMVKHPVGTAEMGFYL